MDHRRARVEVSKLVRNMMLASRWRIMLAWLRVGLVKRKRSGYTMNHILEVDLTGLTFRLDRRHEHHKRNKQINQDKSLFLVSASGLFRKTGKAGLCVHAGKSTLSLASNWKCQVGWPGCRLWGIDFKILKMFSKIPNPSIYQSNIFVASAPVPCSTGIQTHPFPNTHTQVHTQPQKPHA